MRIGIISTNCCDSWGGSEELWAATAHLALRSGIQVSVFMQRERSDHAKWTALWNAGADLFSEPPQTWYRDRIYYRASLLAHRLRSYLQMRPLRGLFSTKPDVLLISDGVNSPPSEVIDCIGHHAPLPYVVVSQANYGNSFSDLYRSKLGKFYRDAYLALFVADANLRATEIQLLKKLQNARVIRNPANLYSLDLEPWPQVPTTRFASVARLNVAHKCQNSLLAVLSDPVWRSRDWQLSLYGDGPDAVYLQELSKYYGLDERVCLAGTTDNIREVWRTHHALVLPSRYEGMPLAVVEAMICGRPVVATAVAGIPEWVRDEQNGFLACAPTVEAYAWALERAWRRRPEWESIGLQARADALALYDPAAGDTLLSLLLEAMRSGGRPGVTGDFHSSERRSLA